MPDLLSPGAESMIRAAVRRRADTHPHLGLHHWLAALLASHRPMLEEALTSPLPADAPTVLDTALRTGVVGPALSEQEVRQAAYARAAERGQTAGRERDIVAVVLDASARGGDHVFATRSQAASPAVSPERKPAPLLPKSSPVREGAKPTPTLDKFGRDLTAEAANGLLPAITARDDEIDAVIETLLRETKRNPVLVGPAGVGKTAIAEGVAQRFAAGQVPAVLAGVRLIALQPSALLAGAGVMGKIEERLRNVIDEATQPGVILFIDEIHSIVGAGGREGTGDMAAQFKPALARGAMACMGATTDDEYRRFIEQDSALERRFQPIRVHEPDTVQARRILTAVRDGYQAKRGVAIDDAVLDWIIEFSDRYLRNRQFPDKAIDILDQAVASSHSRGLASLTLSDVTQTAQRMVGMPVTTADRFGQLRERLLEEGSLSELHVEQLVSRLRLSALNLDVRPARANAVVALVDDARQALHSLARSVAGSLFGSEERVITIDFARFAHEADITILLGSPPGYVGYGEPAPVHGLAQTPWTVLVCQNVDQAHPRAQAVLANALREGHFTDARGKRCYISDAIVLLTFQGPRPSRRALGYQPIASGSEADAADTSDLLGAEFDGLIDIVCARKPVSRDPRSDLKERVLPGVSQRLRAHGLEITWDDSLITWLSGSPPAAGDWSKRLDHELGRALAPWLDDSRKPLSAKLVLKHVRGRVVAEALVTHEGGD